MQLIIYRNIFCLNLKLKNFDINKQLKVTNESKLERKYITRLK